VTRTEVRAAEAYAEANGWWTTRRSAEYVRVDERTLLQYEEFGYLTPVDERRFGILPFKFWDPSEIRRFARERWTSDDPRVARHRDPEIAYELALGRTGSEQAADTARKRALAREGKRRQVIAGRENGAKGGGVGGRKRGPKTKVTREQMAQVRRLDFDGNSYREIAEIVFGDRRFKNRVARLMYLP
jgi:hypothetical protein